MNTNLVTAIVTSSDGVDFAVATQEAAVSFERTFAAQKTAAELEAHGDFLRVEGPASLTETAPQICRLRPGGVVSCETPIEQIASRTVLPGDEPEAVRRARARWGRADFVWGDRS